jgi:hypothetical protein
LGIKYVIGKAKFHLLRPSDSRLNRKSSISQRQINCAAKSSTTRRGILLRDPNRFFVPAINPGQEIRNPFWCA